MPDLILLFLAHVCVHVGVNVGEEGLGRVGGRESKCHQLLSAGSIANRFLGGF